MFVIENSLKGGMSFMEFLKTNLNRLWTDWVRWQMADIQNNVEDYDNNQDKYAKCVQWLAILEYCDILKPSKESYAQWMKIREETFGIMKYIEAAIEYNQNDIGDSLKSDLMMHCYLSIFIELDKMDREMIVSTNNDVNYIWFGGKCVGKIDCATFSCIMYVDQPMWTKQVMIMCFAVGNPDDDRRAEFLLIVKEFYDIVENIMRRFEKSEKHLLKCSGFEPKVSRIIKLLYIFPEWLNDLYTSMLRFSNGELINAKNCEYVELMGKNMAKSRREI
jgi:hypothetical protein